MLLLVFNDFYVYKLDNLKIYLKLRFKVGKRERYLRKYIWNRYMYKSYGNVDFF